MAARTMLVAFLAAMAGCGGKPVVTLVPMPDQSNRVEVSTATAGWDSTAARIAACVVRVQRASTCKEPSPPVCDSRSEEAIRAEQKPIVDSLHLVKLTSSFAMNKQLGQLFPSATPTMNVLDARRSAPCQDWSNGACAAIRTKELAFVFEGDPGGDPKRIQIFAVTPTCREDRPDGW